MKPLAEGDHVMVEGELRSSEYDRAVAGPDAVEVIVPTRTWKIRARAIRKLGRKPKTKSQLKAKTKAA